MRRARVFAAVGLALALVAPAALAEPTKRECIDANTQAQIALKSGRLHEAKAAFQSCAVAACPASVRQDCTERLDAVASRQPSVILAAKDAAGHELVAARVRLDDQPLTDKLDGVAIDVDPGEHELAFEVEGQAPVTVTITLHERDVGHRVEVVIGTKAKPPAPTSPAVGSAPSKATADGSGRRTAGIALGSAGLVGLVVGAVLGGLASSKWSDSQANCPKGSMTRCTKYDAAVADHTSAERLSTFSTIAFVAGSVFVAGGLVLYLTAPRRRSVGLAPTPGGAALVGSF